VCVMMGGLSGKVLYAGLGIVGFPAERTAKISQVMAFSKDSELQQAMAALCSAFVTRLRS